MFALSAGVYPSEATIRCYTLGKASDITQKHYIRLDRPASDKHTSFLRTYTHTLKKFYKFGPDLGLLKCPTLMNHLH
jgi:hypothetical protein